MNQGDDSVKGKSKGTGFQNEEGCISVNLSIYGGVFQGVGKSWGHGPPQFKAGSSQPWNNLIECRFEGNSCNML